MKDTVEKVKVKDTVEKAKDTALKVIIDGDGEFKAICGVEEHRSRYISIGRGEITVDSAAEESVWPVIAKDGSRCRRWGIGSP